MDIFIQNKAGFTSIYLEMQLFLFLIHSLIIYWTASTYQVPATHSMFCLYPWWVYNPEKTKERYGYWPPCKTYAKRCVFKCCEQGQLTLLRTGNRGEIHMIHNCHLFVKSRSYPASRFGCHKGLLENKWTSPPRKEAGSQAVFHGILIH